MGDITASTKVSGQNQNPQSGIPYVGVVENNQMGPLLRDLFSQGRYVAPSAVTIASGVVTIPAGTVVYMREGSGVFRFELIAAVTITADAVNNKVWLRVGTSSDGKNSKVLLLEVGATTPSGALEIGTTSGGPPPSAITLNTGLDKSLPKSEFITVTHPTVEAAGSVFVVSPIAGTIKKVFATPNDTIDATTVLTLKIATVPVTNGLVSLTNAGVAGTAYSATPTAANVVQKGQSIEVASDGAQTAVLAATITIEIEP